MVVGTEAVVCVVSPTSTTNGTGGAMANRVKFAARKQINFYKLVVCWRKGRVKKKKLWGTGRSKLSTESGN